MTRFEWELANDTYDRSEGMNRSYFVVFKAASLQRPRVFGMHCVRVHDCDAYRLNRVQFTCFLDDFINAYDHHRVAVAMFLVTRNNELPGISTYFPIEISEIGQKDSSITPSVVKNICMESS